MKENRRECPQICPRCGQTYFAAPALARDNSGPICPDCGTREALESIGVSPAEQEKILEAIHRAMPGAYS